MANGGFAMGLMIDFDIHIFHAEKDTNSFLSVENTMSHLNDIARRSTRHLHIHLSYVWLRLMYTMCTHRVLSYTQHT